MSDHSIPQDDREVIIEKASHGWRPDEIALYLRKEEGSRVAEDSVKAFVESESAQEKIATYRRLRERKADVAKEELVSDLRDVKDTLIERAEELRQQEMDSISNDAVSNLIDNIKLLGEFIGELQSKEEDAGGVINVNKLEQNFDVVNAVQYMPQSDKESVVEQLKDDPDVENFVIERSS